MDVIAAQVFDRELGRSICRSMGQRELEREAGIVQTGRTSAWMRSAFEISPVRRKKQAKSRRREEQEWASPAGPVVVRVRRQTDQQPEGD
jgi:hypothetical protein